MKDEPKPNTDSAEKRIMFWISRLEIARRDGHKRNIDNIERWLSISAIILRDLGHTQLADVAWNASTPEWIEY